MGGLRSARDRDTFLGCPAAGPWGITSTRNRPMFEGVTTPTRPSASRLLRVVTPAPRDVWTDVLRSDPAAFVYQTPKGIDAICAELDCEDASRLYDFGDGRQLIMPLYRRRRSATGLMVERSPLVGSLVSPGSVRTEELRAVFADLAARPVLRVIIRPTALAGDAWASAVPARVTRLPHVSHVLDLGGGFDTVWRERFNNQARRAVRRAEKAQLEVVCAHGGALLGEFYGLFRRSVDRWAGERHQPRFVARWRAKRRAPFERLQRRMSTLGDACRIWVARVDGRAAASIVVLQGPNAHYTLGAMDKDLAGPVRASFLLQKLAIEDACNAGCRYYNMGETGTSATLARFKGHFGATAHSYDEYRFERIPITALESRLRRVAQKTIRFGRSRSASSP